MYHFHLGCVLSEDAVDRLVTIATRLQPTPGPGGSAMSDPQRTVQVFRSELRWLFRERWARCQVVYLWPSSQIVAHCDASIFPATRYHIPIQSNKNCWVYSADVWQRLLVGGVYRMDPTEPHGAVNWGNTIRMHLLIDEVNDDTP